MFFTIRAAVYFLLWTYLSQRLFGYSKEQDGTGNKWLSNKARFTSSWGMPLFALSTAFAAFDWLMSMDYRFFSTMWGVYFFAGAVFSSVPLVVIMLTLLRARGKLKGLVTEEHLHDMGKLMFAFTVFWAYIGFGQYFLIWYAQIPEETSFFLARKTGGWETLSKFLVIGHFALPFYVLLWRFMRRSFTLLSIMAVWAILLEVVDIYWIVRPFVYAADPTDKVHLGGLWLDIAGIIGPLAIFLGLVAWRVRTARSSRRATRAWPKRSRTRTTSEKHACPTNPNTPPTSTSSPTPGTATPSRMRGRRRRSTVAPTPRPS
jgi:hypothetical protein